MVRFATCVLLAAAVSRPGVARAEDPPTRTSAADELTIVLVGDVGMSRHQLRVSSKGFYRGSKLYQWADLTAGIASLISGDINFMNLETVVSERNNLPRVRKPVNFHSHPDGIRHMIKLGFNLVSLANNHAYDYGEVGMRETLRNVDTFAADGLLGHAGLGADRDGASKPAVVTVRGSKIGFSALGITESRFRAGKSKPGTLSPGNTGDLERVTERLAETGADFRILSIHEGRERRVRPSSWVKGRWRSAVRGNIDLIAGHHAHAVRGIERDGDSLIFWGLGNFLLEGDRDLDKVWSYGLCRDYGLLARVHLRRGPEGRLRARAVQVVPITGVSRVPSPMSAAEGKRRVQVLNYLAGMLDSKKAGSTGVRFAPQSDGSGLYCFEGAGSEPGRVGALCRSYRPPDAPSADQLAAIKRACRVLTPRERNPKPLYGPRPTRRSRN